MNNPNPEAESDICSELIADIGNSFTRVVLIAPVLGQPCVVASAVHPTTNLAPWNDISVGVMEAVLEIAEQSGRALIDSSGDLIRPAKADGTGVDRFRLMISAVPPFRTVTAGLAEEFSLDSARQAMSTIYAREVACLTPTDNRPVEEHIGEIIAVDPDIFLAAGNLHEGSQEQFDTLVDAIILSTRLSPTQKRPIVVVAGDAALHDQAKDRLGEISDLFQVADLRPGVTEDSSNEIRELLSGLFKKEKVAALPGIDLLLKWSDGEATPKVAAFAILTDHAAKAADGRVLAIDIGARAITLASARPGGSRIYLRNDLGMSNMPVGLLTKAGENHQDNPEWAVRLPLLQDLAAHKRLFQRSVPLTHEERDLEQQLAGLQLAEAAKAAAIDWGWSADGALLPMQRIILHGGVLTSGDNLQSTAAWVLASLKAVGVFDLVVDRRNAMPAAGLYVEDCQVDHNLLVDDMPFASAATVVVPRGKARGAKFGVKVEISRDGDLLLEKKIPLGELEIIPVDGTSAVKLVATPGGKLDLGEGGGRAVTRQVIPGELGIIVDTRHLSQARIAG